MTLDLPDEEVLWLRLLLSTWLHHGIWGGTAKTNAESILAKIEKEKGPVQEPLCGLCSKPYAHCICLPL